MTNIIIIGAGNMGKAIGDGLQLNPDNKVFYKTLDNYYTDFEHLEYPWVFLAVKPYQIVDVLQDAKEFLNKINPKAIISVAAGLKISEMKKVDLGNIPAIRAMPNTPVSVGKGLMGFYCDDNSVGSSFSELCIPLGSIHYLKDEEEFHLFTALAGSGPAYVFHLVEALALAAKKLGMTAKAAQEISKQLLIGVSTMLPNDTPTNLRKNVTSPNGTTQAGLEALMNKELDPNTSRLTDLLTETLQAAQEKSKNMM